MRIEKGIKNSTNNHDWLFCKTAEVSNLTSMAPQKAKVINTASAAILINRLIGRGALSNAFIDEKTFTI
jgi:hypothetical protein